MSTRSFINVHMTDGQWGNIYCHSDGYWAHNGLRLYTIYNSQEMAEALIRLGDISYLGEEIGVKHDFDFHGKFYSRFTGTGGAGVQAMYQDPEFIRLNRMCKAYGRDRGETKTKARTGPSLSAVWQEEEYMYAWRDGQWWGTRDAIGDLRPLADILFAEGLIYDDPNAWPENIRRRTFYRPPPPSKRALAI